MTELRVHELLQAAYEGGEISPFDYSAEKWAGDEGLADAKAAADMLASLRLAKYTDDGRTRMALTNAGRYWALHGGFLAFLKEEPEKAGGGRNRSPEAEALRATYMALRLKTFWWSFGMSAAGFVVSIISLCVALTYGDRLLHR
jgi:hypothetical protein